MMLWKRCLIGGLIVVFGYFCIGGLLGAKLWSSVQQLKNSSPNETNVPALLTSIKIRYWRLNVWSFGSIDRAFGKEITPILGLAERSTVLLQQVVATQQDSSIDMQTVSQQMEQVYKEYLNISTTVESQPIWQFVPSRVKHLNQLMRQEQTEISHVFSLLNTTNLLHGKKKILVLLQNNAELRPNGGFLGSYALILLQDGRLQDIQVQDIYVPDGQIKGYVEAPWPIKYYLFQGGGWKLRDSNWDPHFPASAQNMVWFFEQGNVKDVDVVVATHFGVVQNIVRVLGSIYVPDIQSSISAETLYGYAQANSEKYFFPGATNKTNALGGLQRAMLRTLEHSSPEQYLQIMNIILASLRTSDTLVWFKDDAIQQKMVEYGWDGGIHFPKCQKNVCIQDYLYLVEGNLGINKTNCCMERVAVYDLYLNEQGQLRTVLTMQYKNHNPPTPDPPRSYGGGYQNYMRVYKNLGWSFVRGDSLHFAAENQIMMSREIPNLQVMETSGLLGVGGQDVAKYSWEFERKTAIDLNTPFTYSLYIQHQPGLTTNEYEVRWHVPSFIKVSSSNHTVSDDKETVVEHLEVDQNKTLEWTLQKK